MKNQTLFFLVVGLAVGLVIGFAIGKSVTEKADFEFSAKTAIQLSYARQQAIHLAAEYNGMADVYGFEKIPVDHRGVPLVPASY